MRVGGRGDFQLRPSAEGVILRDDYPCVTLVWADAFWVARTNPLAPVRAATDVRYWNEPARGGHFAAYEQPELFVEEVRAFFRLVR